MKPCVNKDCKHRSTNSRDNCRYNEQYMDSCPAYQPEDVMKPCKNKRCIGYSVGQTDGTNCVEFDAIEESCSLYQPEDSGIITEEQAWEMANIAWGHKAFENGKKATIQAWKDAGLIIHEKTARDKADEILANALTSGINVMKISKVQKIVNYYRDTIKEMED